MGGRCSVKKLSSTFKKKVGVNDCVRTVSMTNDNMVTVGLYRTLSCCLTLICACLLYAIEAQDEGGQKSL